MESSSFKTFCDKYQRAVNLSEVESKKDPEDEPFRSKYSARELLDEIKSRLRQLDEEDGEEADGRQQDRPGSPSPADSPSGLLAVRLAVIELQLGVNHTETEELSAGEEHLVNCVRLLERYRLSQECISVYIQAQKCNVFTLRRTLGTGEEEDTQNNLGLLWSGRGEIQVAQTYLESAESLYIQYNKQIGKPPFELHEHFIADEEHFTEQERFKRFERVHTYTLYYLAQVYKHLELIEKAAQYCHTTLQRQLEYTVYNPVEWAINAATLSQYYLPKVVHPMLTFSNILLFLSWMKSYVESRHCLAAANVILRQADQMVHNDSTEEKISLFVLKMR